MDVFEVADYGGGMMDLLYGCIPTDDSAVAKPETNRYAV